MIRVRQLGPREIDARIRTKQPMLVVFVPAADERTSYNDDRGRISPAQYAVLEEELGADKWIEIPFTQD